jgi:hypothetical protein
MDLLVACSWTHGFRVVPSPPLPRAHLLELSDLVLGPGVVLGLQAWSVKHTSTFTEQPCWPTCAHLARCHVIRGIASGERDAVPACCRAGRGQGPD